MTSPVPETVYNGAGYLGIFNFQEERRPGQLALAGPLEELLRGAQSLRDVWTGEEWHLRGARIDMGELEAHGSRLLEVLLD
jgi:hypothetical protein